jgi:peptidoglycan/LPS O-acetylase OafA/YrhL
LLTRNSGEHILALDGVRGIAILLVMANHWVALLRLEGTGPLSTALVEFSKAGWTGVNLFFALSGFLITGILLDAKGGDRYLRAFFTRRILRIWPVYFGWLFVIFLVLPSLGIAQGENYEAARQNQGWYWSHLTNVMMAIREIAPRPDYPTTHFWSLAVEEQFYLVWPFVVRACSPKALLRVCLIGTVAALVGRIAAYSGGVPPEAIYVITPLRMDALLLGGAFAVVLRHPVSWLGKREWLAIAATGIAGLVAIPVVNGRFVWADFAVTTFGDLFLAMAAMGFVVVGATVRAGSTPDRLLSWSALRSIGKYSYAMYIVHTAVVRQFGVYAPIERPVLGSLALSQTMYFLLYLAQVYLVAWVSWHLVEKRFLSLKRFVPYGRRPVPEVGPGI